MTFYGASRTVEEHQRAGPFVNRKGAPMQQVCRTLTAIVAALINASGSHAQAPASKLRVATRIIPPFVMQDKGQLTGFSIDLWNSIATELHVESSFEVKESVADLLAAVQKGDAD